MNSNCFLISKITILLVFILFFLNFLIFQNLVYSSSKIQIQSQDNKVVPAQTPQEISKQKEDLIEEVEQTDITTRIYKSTDSTLDKIGEETQLEQTLEDEVIHKDELLGSTKSNKVIKRGVKKDKSVVREPNDFYFPWLVTISLLVVLFFIFKFLLSRKL